MPVVTTSVASVTPAGSSTTRLNAGRDELPEIVWPRDPFNVSVLVPWTIVPLLTMLPATETLLPFSRNVPTTVRLPEITRAKLLADVVNVPAFTDRSCRTVIAVPSVVVPPLPTTL